MSAAPALPYEHAMPATDAELARIPLPVDVRIGLTQFRKGTPLLAMVNQHRAFYGLLYEGKDREFT